MLCFNVIYDGILEGQAWYNSHHLGLLCLMFQDSTKTLKRAPGFSHAADILEAAQPVSEWSTGSEEIVTLCA